MKPGIHLFGGGTTARRREVRRAIPHETPPWRQWINQRQALWATLFCLFFTGVAGLLAIRANEQAHYSIQQVLTHPVIARVAFNATDSEKTKQNQDDAVAREPNVYQPNERFFQGVRDRLQSLLAQQISQATRQSLHLTPAALATLNGLIVSGQPQPQWQESVGQLMRDLAEMAVLTPERAKFERDNRATRILIHPYGAGSQDRSELKSDTQIISADEPDDIRSAVTQAVDKVFPKPLRDTIITLVLQHGEESYEYDAVTSDQQKQAVAQRVPKVETPYRPNDLVVPAGKELTSIDTELLAKERQAYLESLAAADGWLPYLIDAGRVGTIALISLILWGYILAYNPRLVGNPLRGLALSGLMLLCLFLAVVVSTSNPRWVYVTAIWPTIMAAMVVAIAYDRRFALAMGTIQTLLVVVILDLPVDFGLVVLVGMGTAVSQLNEVRTRSKLVIAGIWSGLAMAITALATGLAFRPLLLPLVQAQLLSDAKMALGTGVATGMIVQIALPAIEKLFKVTTSMTLKELNDASHPLLRRLAQEAPGTYQHSLRIADMAEAAAAAIGADSLLCKVGAMYHDIGKINKPLYFVENQGGGPNRHSKLSPAMSLLIIVGHVKDGVEMAREYHVPVRLRHFIESHHGTTLVEYFYHAARQRRDSKGALGPGNPPGSSGSPGTSGTSGTAPRPGPSEFEFRYPGPKPQTREAAIMMLCDAVEGAARAMPEPSAPRLEALVHNIAQKRLTDGQFDQCNLTLQELHKIEVAVTKTLVAMYHGRIAYPKEGAEGQAAAEAS